MPTYNRRDGLPQVIEPLLADSSLRELVLVVDGCDDGSFEWAQERSRRDARLVPVFIENSGEMGARQAGAERATSDVVVFVDDDVVAGPDLAARHAGRHAAGENLVVIGYMPTLVPEQPAPDMFATVLYAGEYERMCSEFERDPGVILDHLWAGNMSLRRDDALRVGMPNPSYTERYHPDREFGLRCKAAGLTGAFERRAWGVHVHARPLPAFLRDAHSQGAGRRLVHSLHHDAVGPLPADAFTDGLPAPARAFVDACRRPRAYAAARPALEGAVRVAQRAGSLEATIGFAKILRRVEQQHGAIAGARRAHGDAPAG
jgi:glycosyltransferase involved in cell wall biosynthesis